MGIQRLGSEGRPASTAGALLGILPGMYARMILSSTGSMEAGCDRPMPADGGYRIALKSGVAMDGNSVWGLSCSFGNGICCTI